MDNKQKSDKATRLVRVLYHGKEAGLYCARLVGNRSVVLRHGAISFPAGTALTIHLDRFTGRESGHTPMMAIVMYNSARGMLLTLQTAMQRA